MGTTTSNLSLYKPAEGETGWGDEVNANFDTIDSKIGVDYVHVRDYVVGDGTTDDTEAYQDAVDAAIDQQKPLIGMWPGHTIKIAGTVNITPITTTSPGQYSNFFRLIGPYAGFQNPSNVPTDASATKILCTNASGPAFKFFGVTNSGGIYRVMIDGLKIWAGADRFGQPLIQLGDATQAGEFWVRDLFLDGRSSDGWKSDGVLVHTPVVGSFRDCFFQNMAAGVGWRVWNASAINSGNLTWQDCTVIYTNPASKGGGVGWLLREYYGTGSGGLTNSTMMSNCKAVCPTDNPNRYYNSFLALVVDGAHSAGASTVDVVDATGVQIGQWLTFSSSTSNRTFCDMVQSVSSNTITLQSGSLRGALNNADACIVGNWHTVCGPMTGLVMTVPHWENTGGLLCSGTKGVEIIEPLLGNYVPRGVYVVRGSSRIRLRGGQGATPVTVPDNSVYFHQGNDAGNVRNSVCEVNLSDLGSWGGATNPLIIKNESGSAGAVGYRDTTSWTTVAAGSTEP